MWSFVLGFPGDPQPSFSLKCFFFRLPDVLIRVNNCRFRLLPEPDTASHSNSSVKSVVQQKESSFFPFLQTICPDTSSNQTHPYIHYTQIIPDSPLFPVANNVSCILGFSFSSWRRNCGSFWEYRGWTAAATTKPAMVLRPQHRPCGDPVWVADTREVLWKHSWSPSNNKVLVSK